MALRHRWGHFSASGPVRLLPAARRPRDNSGMVFHAGGARICQRAHEAGRSGPTGAVHQSQVQEDLHVLASVLLDGAVHALQQCRFRCRPADFCPVPQGLEESQVHHLTD